ncbi:hypothetical protein RxyAA322_27090 [Rubrobacter xylanophilus]|uniref:Uncharacterized protein n=1 Tax=Rubrobacter xylanophilus TaxID=49319 RepID=A0A510HN83_9ACTN|nr:hypothetical protein [Rubrobacter xylanophilus]BBL80855.1 hypothetical protein RxyAA322_27090 [Rubrobacter xylanophilus]
MSHVVIVGGPEPEDELLAIVLDDGEAIPVFSSEEEAREFLESTGDLGREWRPLEVSSAALAALLEHQGEEVRYVVLSPPPENWEGGMEVRVVEREMLVNLLHQQAETTSRRSTGEHRGGLLRRVLRRIFGERS